MPQTKEDTPAISIVDATEADPGNTMGDDREQHGTAPTDVMDRPMTEEEKGDRALLALQVAAISGFMGSVQSTQTSCLSLCNTCRENVPVQRLKISHCVPPSILAIVYPGLHQAENEDASRVSPYRRVLNVHWTFANSPRLGEFLGTKRQEEEAARDTTDLAVGVNVDMSEVRWPQGTWEIALCAFNRRLDTVTWPPDLDIVWFGEPNVAASTTYRIPDSFNSSLDGVAFPAGLREIFLGDSFDRPIEGVAWPPGLERLSMAGFNQLIRDVQWPPGLKALEFVSPSRIRLWKDGGTDRDFEECHQAHMGRRTYMPPQGQGCFNQPLGTTLPPSLESLWLSRGYKQPLDSVAWPSGMVALGLAFDFGGYRFADGMALPSSLRDLFLVHKPLWGMRCPRGCEVTALDTFTDGYSSQSSYGRDYDDRYSDDDQCYCSDDDSDRYVDHVKACY